MVNQMNDVQRVTGKYLQKNEVEVEENGMLIRTRLSEDRFLRRPGDEKIELQVRPDRKLPGRMIFGCYA